MMNNESVTNVSKLPQQMLYIVQEFTNQTFWFSPSTVIALVISYCVFMVAGLAANIIVIIVICQKKILRSTRNIFILNLSVCDVIMCSICMPFSLVKLTLKKWTMGLVMCRGGFNGWFIKPTPWTDACNVLAKSIITLVALFLMSGLFKWPIFSVSLGTPNKLIVYPRVFLSFVFWSDILIPSSRRSAVSPSNSGGTHIYSTIKSYLITTALATIDVLVSTLTIIVIAIDRYSAIVHTTQVTKRHVVSALVIIWSLAIVLSTPLFCFHKIDTQELFQHTFVQQCIDHWPDELFREIYTTAVMLIQYLAPTCFISFLHARICKFLQYRLEERPGNDTQIQTKAKEDLKRHRRNMVLLTAMALVFSVTWLPLTLLNITADLEHEVFQESQYNLLHAISLLLAMSSSVANPVMYGWFNTNFRKAFCQLLGFQEAVSGNVKFSSNERNQKKYTSLRKQQECNPQSSSHVNVHSQLLRFNSSPGLKFNNGRHSLNDLSKIELKQFSLDVCNKYSHSLQDLTCYKHKEETASLEYKPNAIAKKTRLKFTEKNPLVLHSHQVFIGQPYGERNPVVSHSHDVSNGQPYGERNPVVSHSHDVSNGHPYGERNPVVLHSHDVSNGQPYGEFQHRKDCYRAHHESSLAICSQDDKTVSLHLLNVVVEMSPETHSTLREHSYNAIETDLK